ncbi:MAG: N-acetyltransferase family protein [Lawsonibacter sp.]|nr:N-acetyltransferase family protein [Lawsonibacter sp.]
MKLRLATPADSQALLNIYSQYINTSITFEYELPTREEFARRISSTLELYPYLVLEDHGRPVGYAYAHQLRERIAYQWSAELSIYLDADAAGRGTGKRLYTALMDLIRLQGVRTVYGVVTHPNSASERLHRSLGFVLRGIHRNTGYKNGAWLDVAWYEKCIAPYDPEPRPVLPIRQVASATVDAILNASFSE